jgi:hypothetical protein
MLKILDRRALTRPGEPAGGEAHLGSESGTPAHAEHGDREPGWNRASCVTGTTVERGGSSTGASRGGPAGWFPAERGLLRSGTGVPGDRAPGSPAPGRGPVRANPAQSECVHGGAGPGHWVGRRHREDPMTNTISTRDGHADGAQLREMVAATPRMLVTLPPGAGPCRAVARGGTAKEGRSHRRAKVNVDEDDAGSALPRPGHPDASSSRTARSRTPWSARHPRPKWSAALNALA